MSNIQLKLKSEVYSLKRKCPYCGKVYYEPDRPMWICLRCGRIWESESERNRCDHKGIDGDVIKVVISE